MVNVLLVGPTSAPWESIASEVEADLARLARPGVELTYRRTGAGPSEIRTDTTFEQRHPSSSKTIVDAAHEGYDAVIVDCTADPGVVDARGLVGIPVVGAGEALRSAIASAAQPVCELTGDDLRGMDVASLVQQLAWRSNRRAWAAPASLISSSSSPTANPKLVVLDPLELALDACLARLPSE